MQIFIKSSSSIPIDVNPTSTVREVMKVVEDLEAIPCSLQRLSFGSLPLNPEETLASCGVAGDDTLQVLMRLNGGMRAKWRKKRMRRLRRKRRKMRQRAR